MSHATLSDNLLALFDDVLTQRASEEQFAELEQLLDRNEPVRKCFAEYSVLSADLRHAYRTGATEGVERIVPREEPLPPTRPGPPPSAYFWAIALAGSVLIAAVLSVNPEQKCADPLTKNTTDVSESSKPPAPVATLAYSRRAVWLGTQVVDGDALHEGRRLTLISGEARISVGSGAEMVVNGPCSLTLVSTERVHLHAGDVAVQVAEWAHGFSVTTEGMEVIDLGTTFTVSVTEGTGAETAVLKGQVRVNPKKAPEFGPRSVLVNEGQAVQVDNLGGDLRRITEAQYPGRKLDFGALEPYRPVALFNTGYGAKEGDEDPNWRVIASSAKDLPSPEFAVVCKPDERYLPNAPESSQWVSMANWQNAQPNTTYTFQTKFDLTGFDLSTVQFFGRFLADNGIGQVRINGKPVKVESWVDNVEYQSFGHSQFRFVNVTSGLREGVNEIEIDVRNGIFEIPEQMRNDPNPMALRVEWYVFGRHLRELVGEEGNSVPASRTRSKSKVG